MCNVNLILRTIIYVIFSILIIFIDNYYLFWLLVFYVLLMSIVDRNYKSLLLNFCTVLILLFCYFSSKIKLLIKITLLINFAVTYFCSFSKKEKDNLRYSYRYREGIKSRKALFFDNNKDRLFNENKRLLDCVYKRDLSLDNKNVSDLNNLYIFSKTRFYGYSNKITNFRNKWNWYDTLFLIVAVFVLILIYIYW